MSSFAAGRPWTLGADLLVLNGFLQLMDLATTAVILHAGGFEVNPVSRAIMAHAGMGAWILLKVLIAMTLLLLVLPIVDVEKHHHRIINTTLGSFTVLMALVLLNNGLVIYGHVL